MQVSALRIYPVKSTAGLDLPEAALHTWGLDDDRRWMVVDEAGRTLTASKYRRLLLVTATPGPGGGLVLSAPGRSPLQVGAPDPKATISLTMSRVDRAVTAGDAAAGWLSEHLGKAVRLVWLDDPRRRTVAPAHGGRSGEPMAFADAGPVLLTTTRSLAQLNEWLVETARDRGEPAPAPLPMIRFRPNIVVEGSDEPFAEDGWKRLRVGEVELRFGEHCDRCVVPTIDPVTLAGAKEPTRTLALRRQWDHEVYFGTRLIPVVTGVVRVGDEITVC